MNNLRLIKTITCQNLLGEAIQWNATDGAFWWTDIHGLTLHKYLLATEQHCIFPLNEKISSFCFDINNNLLAAFASGFAWFNPYTNARIDIARAEDTPGNRSNDGRCDRQGRFWMGTLVEQAQSKQQVAGLYCLDQKFRVTQHLSGLRISNALCWSPDGTTLYHTDSPTGQIYAYPFNIETGTLGHPRLLASTETGVEPDGACVDSEGFIWSAQWGGKRVRRYHPSGELSLELNLPVSQPTCCAFGGDDYSLLAITSANIGLTAAQQAHEPGAGNLFIFSTPFRGLAESRFNGYYFPVIDDQETVDA